MKKIITLFILISLFTFGAEEFKIEETKRKDKPFGFVIKNPNGKIMKEYRYQKFDRDKNPIKLDVIERTERAKKVGEVEITYNKGKRLFSIEKNLEGDVVEVGFYFEREGTLIEEIRDGNGLFIKFLEHKEKSLIDVTNEMIEERWINKMVINEDQLLQVVKPLDSLQLILERDSRMVLSNALINFSAGRSTVKDTLMGQLVTDSIREYVNSDAVIYNGGNLNGKIAVGPIRYENIKDIIDDEKLYLFRVWGETLEEIFKHASELPYAHREYPNVAGLTWDTTMDEIHLEIAGEAIDKFKKYSVVVNEYIKDGNGIYYPFKDLKAYELRHPASIIMAEYLRKIDIVDKSYLVEKRHITIK